VPIWARSAIRAEAFLRDVEGRPYSPEAGVARRIAGTTHWFAGEYPEARDQLEHALAIFQPGRDDDLAFRGRKPKMIRAQKAMRRFAQEERARLAEDEKIASQRVREIAYRLWQEEGCPGGEALRHRFAAKAIFDSEAEPECDCGGGEVRPHSAGTELS
jgi:hypothetical protein